MRWDNICERFFRGRLAMPSRIIIKGLVFLVPLCLISLEIYLNVLVVGFAIIGLLLLILFTSPLWLILFIFWWPLLLGVTCILRITSLRTYTRWLLTSSLHYVLYKYNGNLRKKCWSLLYSLLSFGLPNNIIGQNCGFALVTANGESL